MLREYDINESGVVQRSEFRSPGSQFGSLSGADADGDGEVDRQELSLWLANRMPELPSDQLTLDFQSRDADQDGQVSLREYAPTFQRDSVDVFERWDRNGDGFVTSAESQHRLPSRGVEYSNGEVQVLKPNATIVSRIWVEDDKVIDAITVYVTISKESDNYTEVHLLGPDGRRVTLYEGGAWVSWTGALILKDITFSDRAPTIRQPLRQPPNPRALAPPGVGQDEMPSLGDLQGLGTRGLWRLVVVNQNNRAGVLLGWALRVTSKAEVPDESAYALKRTWNGRLKYFRMLDRSNEPGSVWDQTANRQGFGRIAGTTGIRQFGPAGEMVGEYTSRNRDRTRGTFRNYDANRDGMLSREEVGAAYRTAIYDWFTAGHDKNKNGTIDRDEVTWRRIPITMVWFVVTNSADGCWPRCLRNRAHDCPMVCQCGSSSRIWILMDRCSSLNFWALGPRRWRANSSGTITMRMAWLPRASARPYGWRQDAIRERQPGCVRSPQRNQF